MGLSDATTMLRIYQVSISLESDGCLSSGTLWWMSAVKPFSNKNFPVADLYSHKGIMLALLNLYPQQYIGVWWCLGQSYYL